MFLFKSLQNQKYIFFHLPVVLFISLDCFGVSCLVLERGGQVCIFDFGVNYPFKVIVLIYTMQIVFSVFSTAILSTCPSLEANVTEL